METQRTKIVFVIGTLDIGGAEHQLVELASRLDRGRFAPIVCSISPGGRFAETLRARGVPVYSLNFRRQTRNAVAYVAGMPRLMRAVWDFWRLLRRERPQIVHGFLLVAYLLSTFVGRLAGVRVIVTSRRSLGLFKEKKPWYLLLERLADGLTDLVIANSEAVRQDTLAREPVLRESQVIVIHNGIDLSRFDSDSLSSPVRGLSVSGGPCAIVVSNLIAYKGHEFFLRAWRDVLAVHPSAVALLAGDGVLRADLERLTETLGIRHAVRFLGLRHDVPALLAAADVYVHPSLEEGYSNALLEAMAAGCPIVATAVGGNVEAIADGETGLLVPAGNAVALRDALLRILSDPTGAGAMGARARGAVRARHDMGAMIRSYEAVYEALLDSHHPATAPAGITR